jgi:SAM-dependent methyltransferase
VIVPKKDAEPEATDWTEYYRATPFTANLTRRYTSSVLISVLRKYTVLSSSSSGCVVEFGGANSCFLDKIYQELTPREYHIVDTNEYGLHQLEKRIKPEQNVRLHNVNALEYFPSMAADVVFSVGLIEHFDQSGTEAMIRAHFRALRPAGCAIISFPTPTWLYRVARSLTETFGLWKFPDERPLCPSEVVKTVRQFGDILYQRTLWPLVFTQHLMVIRRTSSGAL